MSENKIIPGFMLKDIAQWTIERANDLQMSLAVLEHLPWYGVSDEHIHKATNDVLQDLNMLIRACNRMSEKLTKLKEKYHDSSD